MLAAKSVEGGNDLAEHPNRAVRISGSRGHLEHFNSLEQRSPMGLLFFTNPQDAGNGGWFDLFIGRKHLFAEFFAGAEANVLDRYVSVGDQSRKLDQVPGHLGDPCRFAHFKQVDRAGFHQRRCMEDELDRLRDEHKKTPHPGIRHRDRPSGAYLFEKSGYDAAVAAQHIAEAHRSQLQAGFLRDGFDHKLRRSL